tara:strand:- start:58 stop:570 length:513 start_codon:yes stop_codon:yes gene_type:complete
MLNKKEIQQLIQEKNLVKDYINLDKQLAPNGIDLTVGQVFKFTQAGSLDFSNSQRIVPQGEEIIPKKRQESDKYGWWELERGAYKIRTNETVSLPNNLAALGFSRTSVLRMGALTQNGVWDAGFSGKGEFILTVENPQGINIKQNARIIQLIFYRVEETEKYNGIYNNLK